MRTFGRLLQLIALITLPIAMLLELTDALGRSFGLSQLLVALIFGILAFLLGRLLEGYAGGPQDRREA